MYRYKSLALVSNFTEIVSAFAEWQKSLVNSSKRIRDRIYRMRGTEGIYFELSNDRNGEAFKSVKFSENIDFNPAIVKINIPNNVKTTNGHSHVLGQGDSRFIVRQGRLNHNPRNPQNIVAEQFEALCDADPIFQSKQEGQDPRNWFLVCQLGLSPTDISAQTVAFVIMCRDVRRALADQVQPLNLTHSAAEVRSSRNPSWNREELILALELYVEHAGNPPGQESQVIAELSALLNRLGERRGQPGRGTYRNPNGVHMKLMNFRRFDPAYTQAGRTGLSRGGKLEEVVWNEFYDDQDALRKVASLIRAEVELPVAIQEEHDDEAEEGAIILALHRRRERNHELVKKRKKQALRQCGDLRCEACDISFADKYGERGDGFIEVHHTKPLHRMEPGDKTHLSDLALVCANCHRMIHRRMPWLTMGELRDLVVKG